MTLPEERVIKAVRRIGSHPQFESWAVDEKIADGDLILFNNSFVFHDVQTDKSSHYLAVEVGPEGQLKTPPSVATLPTRQNLDFRRLAKTQARPALQPLQPSISREIGALGHLIFGLIGNVTEDRLVEVTPKTGSIKRIVWNPKATELLTLDADVVEINSVENEDALWTAYEKAAEASELNISPHTQPEFAEALDTLLGLGAASLRLPEPNTSSRPGILDTIVNALRGQVSDYADGLAKYTRAQSDETRKTHFNEMLRVAYAFSQEASTLLRLIVSVCDLKPLVLWATIDKHYQL
jgi:hypothetical protein